MKKMNLLCHMRDHSPAAPGIISAQGFAFSKCRRCHCDMLRSSAHASARWIRVPEEFRVVWGKKPPDFSHRLATRLRYGVCAAVMIELAHGLAVGINAFASTMRGRVRRVDAQPIRLPDLSAQSFASWWVVRHRIYLLYGIRRLEFLPNQAR